MNSIREKLIRVSQLIDGGDLERDLALALLREIYTELKFGEERTSGSPTRTDEAIEAPEPYIETEHVVFRVEPIEEPEPEFDPTPATPAMPATAPAPAPAPEPFVPRPAVAPEVIRSLYGDTAPRETLNDASRPEARDVASAAAAAATPITASLRKSIGLNDRFVMIRDMFRGDTAAFDRTIDRLDGFEGLDEAVIWLHDNLTLDPDSEGVGLLMNLLERKFS